MANGFNKEERVAFEQILEGFQDALDPVSRCKCLWH